MNKETRQFIVGLLGSLLCCTSISIQVYEMHNGTWIISAWNIFLLISTLWGCISFGIMLHKSI